MKFSRIKPVEDGNFPPAEICRKHEHSKEFKLSKYFSFKFFSFSEFLQFLLRFISMQQLSNHFPAIIHHLSTSQLLLSLFKTHNQRVSKAADKRFKRSTESKCMFIVFVFMSHQLRLRVTLI
jgi:sensor histidine kinase YesM